MKSATDDEEFCEQPFPSPEALAANAGKVIAFDETGEIREVADSWAEMLERVPPRDNDDPDPGLCTMYVPAGSFVG